MLYQMLRYSLTMEEIIINIAVVEDEQQQILNYQNYLDRFQKERKITVKKATLL